jgi:hypothetical protein
MVDNIVCALCQKEKPEDVILSKEKVESSGWVKLMLDHNTYMWTCPECQEKIKKMCLLIEHPELGQRIIYFGAEIIEKYSIGVKEND